MSVSILDGLHRTVLDNGLEVLVKPVRTAPLVSVWCWYHVGSKDEGPGTTGISHFVEHMNFKGTEEISREDLKVWIERAGGTWNGYTWIDQTTYFETLAADSLDLALHIEAERMNACVYDQDEFDSERTVVLAEMHGNRNNPQYELDIDVTAAALRMHGYRWPTIGWQSDVETMTRQDLVDHYQRYYVPSNATVVIVGDVEVGEAAAAVERRFGAIPSGEVAAARAVSEPTQNGERRVVLDRPGSTGYLEVAYRAPEFTSADFAPLLLADAALAGGKGVNLWSGGFGRSARTTSPLYDALIESELVVSVGSALLPTEEPYLYSFSATLRDGVDHRRAEEALFRSVSDLTVEGVDDHGLAKAKNQVLASFAFESEQVTQIAHQLGYYSTIADLDSLDALPGRIESVTADEVRDVAQRILEPDNRTVGWVVPGGGE
ncbi:MAG: insulinase family protein [Acidobacteria bacterium]|nr:insulinase family protein [Acidobacteriota bacterium]